VAAMKTRGVVVFMAVGRPYGVVLSTKSVSLPGYNF